MSQMKARRGNPPLHLSISLCDPTSSARTREGTYVSFELGVRPSSAVSAAFGHEGNDRF